MITSEVESFTFTNNNVQLIKYNIYQFMTRFIYVVYVISLIYISSPAFTIALNMKRKSPPDASVHATSSPNGSTSDHQSTLSKKFATICVHVGSEPDAVTGAVVPPISLATTFAQNGLGNRSH